MKKFIILILSISSITTSIFAADSCYRLQKELRFTNSSLQNSIEDEADRLEILNEAKLVSKISFGLFTASAALFWGSLLGYAVQESYLVRLAAQAGTTAPTSPILTLSLPGLGVTAAAPSLYAVGNGIYRVVVGNEEIEIEIKPKDIVKSIDQLTELIDQNQESIGSVDLSFSNLRNGLSLGIIGKRRMAELYILQVNRTELLKLKKNMIEILLDFKNC